MVIFPLSRKLPAISSILSTGILAVLCCFSSPATAQNWNLVWSDEFDGAGVNLNKWEFQIGDGSAYGIPGWGNNELQWYRSENAAVENGLLLITAKKESFAGHAYTSTRMRTRQKGDWKYGRIEMRARLPFGKGLWPAFWMLPTDNIYGGWAASGEIDIMELVGHEPNKTYGTLHYGGPWPNNTSSGSSYTLPAKNFSDDFHVFAIEWKPGEIRWYVDNVHYQTQTNWWSTGGPFPAPFDQRFHLLLNVAVGGNWPGNPDASTIFPQRLEADYVRVYQVAGATEVDEKNLFLPKEFSLGQNHPNPFNPRTTISYAIAREQFVILKVYDIRGREMTTLVSQQQRAGYHRILFHASDLPGGVYIYKLLAGDYAATRKMLLIR
jgi:beta-glucanase (GH16 family)